MLSTDSRKFEDEVIEGLDLDDVEILTRRVRAHQEYVSLLKPSCRRGVSHSRTQWTRIHDGVQEHFSSHVLINNSAYKLPSNIYAMKQISKQSWMLYKKRECERRKRLRVKLEREREIEAKGGPANILLSMVDACEICKKLYVTVNLFWGLTLCDTCYFNEDIIKDIMKQRKDFINNEENNPYRIVEKVLEKPSLNDRFFELPKEKEEVVEDKVESKFFEVSPEVIVDDKVPEEDSRPISTYIPPPIVFDDDESSEEVIHEETDSDDPLQFEGYFSQTSFVSNGEFISD